MTLLPSQVMLQLLEQSERLKPLAVAKTPRIPRPPKVYVPASFRIKTDVPVPDFSRLAPVGGKWYGVQPIALESTELRAVFYREHRRVRPVKHILLIDGFYNCTNRRALYTYCILNWRDDDLDAPIMQGMQSFAAASLGDTFETLLASNPYDYFNAYRDHAEWYVGAKLAQYLENVHEPV